MTFAAHKHPRDAHGRWKALGGKKLPKIQYSANGETSKGETHLANVKHWAKRAQHWRTTLDAEMAKSSPNHVVAALALKNLKDVAAKAVVHATAVPDDAEAQKFAHRALTHMEAGINEHEAVLKAGGVSTQGAKSVKAAKALGTGQATPVPVAPTGPKPKPTSSVSPDVAYHSQQAALESGNAKKAVMAAKTAHDAGDGYEVSVQHAKALQAQQQFNHHQGKLGDIAAGMAPGANSPADVSAAKAALGPVNTHAANIKTGVASMNAKLATPLVPPKPAIDSQGELLKVGDHVSDTNNGIATVSKVNKDGSVGLGNGSVVASAAVDKMSLAEVATKIKETAEAGTHIHVNGVPSTEKLELNNAGHKVGVGDQVELHGETYFISNVVKDPGTITQGPVILSHATSGEVRAVSKSVIVKDAKFVPPPKAPGKTPTPGKKMTDGDWVEDPAPPFGHARQLTNVKAFTEDYQKFNAKLTSEERTAILDYSNGDYSAMNAYMRGDKVGTNFNPTVEKQIAAADAGIAKSTMHEDTVVIRGETHAMEFYEHFQPGDVMLMKSYGSSSAFKSSAFKKKVMFAITVPAGHQAAPIPSNHSHEKEYLLPRGAKYRVDKVENFPGAAYGEKVMHLTMISHGPYAGADTGHDVTQVKISALSHDLGVAGAKGPVVMAGPASPVTPGQNAGAKILTQHAEAMTTAAEMPGSSVTHAMVSDAHYNAQKAYQDAIASTGGASMIGKSGGLDAKLGAKYQAAIETHKELAKYHSLKANGVAAVKPGVVTKTPHELTKIAEAESLKAHAEHYSLQSQADAHAKAQKAHADAAAANASVFPGQANKHELAAKLHAEKSITESDAAAKSKQADELTQLVKSGQATHEQAAMAHESVAKSYATLVEHAEYAANEAKENHFAEKLAEHQIKGEFHSEMAAKEPIKAGDQVKASYHLDAGLGKGMNYVVSHVNAAGIHVAGMLPVNHEDAAKFLKKSSDSIKLANGDVIKAGDSIEHPSLNAPHVVESFNLPADNPVGFPKQHEDVIFSTGEVMKLKDVQAHAAKYEPVAKLKAAADKAHDEAWTKTSNLDDYFDGTKTAVHKEISNAMADAAQSHKTAIEALKKLKPTTDTAKAEIEGNITGHENAMKSHVEAAQHYAGKPAFETYVPKAGQMPSHEAASFNQAAKAKAASDHVATLKAGKATKLELTDAHIAAAKAHLELAGPHHWNEANEHLNQASAHAIGAEAKSSYANYMSELVKTQAIPFGHGDAIKAHQEAMKAHANAAKMPATSAGFLGASHHEMAAKHHEEAIAEHQAAKAALAASGNLPAQQIHIQTPAEYGSHPKVDPSTGHLSAAPNNPPMMATYDDLVKNHSSKADVASSKAYQVDAALKSNDTVSALMNRVEEHEKAFALQKSAHEAFANAWSAVPFKISTTGGFLQTARDAHFKQMQKHADIIKDLKTQIGGHNLVALGKVQKEQKESALKSLDAKTQEAHELSKYAHGQDSSHGANPSHGAGSTGEAYNHETAALAHRAAQKAYQEAEYSVPNMEMAEKHGKSATEHEVKAASIRGEIAAHVAVSASEKAAKATKIKANGTAVDDMAEHQAARAAHEIAHKIYYEAVAKHPTHPDAGAMESMAAYHQVQAESHRKVVEKLGDQAAMKANPGVPTASGVMVGSGGYHNQKLVEHHALNADQKSAHVALAMPGVTHADAMHAHEKAIQSITTAINGTPKDHPAIKSLVELREHHQERANYHEAMAEAATEKAKKASKPVGSALQLAAKAHDMSAALAAGDTSRGSHADAMHAHVAAEMAFAANGQSSQASHHAVEAIKHEEAAQKAKNAFDPALHSHPLFAGSDLDPKKLPEAMRVSEKLGKKADRMTSKAVLGDATHTQAQQAHADAFDAVAKINQAKIKANGSTTSELLAAQEHHDKMITYHFQHKLIASHEATIKSNQTKDVNPGGALKSGEAGKAANKLSEKANIISKAVGDSEQSSDHVHAAKAHRDAAVAQQARGLLNLADEHLVAATKHEKLAKQLQAKGK